MAPPRLPLRLILAAALALAAALLLGLVLLALNSALEFYQRLVDVPLWLRAPLLALAALLLAGGGWLLWRLARPATRPRARAPEPVRREAVEAAIAGLRSRAVDTTALEAELQELDRRRASGELHIALFGEVSTGKSSLLRALAPDADTARDVIAGTTQAVSLHRGHLPDGRELVIADVPGSGEVGGAAREALARDEALRAHAVLVLVQGDLSRSQATEVRWLAGFGKPLLVVLNKADLYAPAELQALQARLRERVPEARAVVAVSAGGSEHFERVLADGRREQVTRERRPDVAALLAALERVLAPGAAALEPAREAAVLAAVGQRGDALAAAAAARESEATVRRYTRRAIVGALAAVMPGSDVLIQGALGTGLVRELARIHGVAVRELDVEALLSRIGLNARSSTAIALAIAGNAMKAFPGLGTLGGGFVHAIAYGLVFDSLGTALAETLAERSRLDAAAVAARMEILLQKPARARIEQVARLALEAARGREAAE